MPDKKIVWSIPAKDQFKKIIAYIKKDSPQNAANVKKDILEKISGIINQPHKFPADKYKLLNNDNAYRVFELHRIRISYFVDEKFIMIIRLGHTKQEPLFY